MLNVAKGFRFWLIAGILLALPIIVCGQDLGSSNGLFRVTNATPKKDSPAATGKKSASKSASAKKAVSKTRKAAAGTNRAIVKTPVKTPTATAKKSTAKIQPSATKPIVNRNISNDIIINSGKPSAKISEELFEKAIDEGNLARDDRNYVKAETAYRRALGYKPKDSRAIYGLGNLYSDQQRWEEAEKAYRQAISLEPKSPEAYIALSFVLTQPVLGANLGDRYSEAEIMARRAIDLDGENAIAYDQLGVALELRGQIGSETQNAYRQAIKIDSNFALAYAHLGRLLRRNGLTNESAAAYRDAVRLSSDVPTMILVADVMQSQQRYSDSEQLLRRALREDQRNPTALYLLGRALTTRGNFEEAEKLLKKSVEVSPNSFVPYTLLSSVYARRGNLDEAERTLMQALRVVSGNEKKRLAQEFEAVGDGFMKVGKRADAVRVYRQAMALDKDKIDLNAKISKAERG